MLSTKALAGNNYLEKEGAFAVVEPNTLCHARVASFCFGG